LTLLNQKINKLKVAPTSEAVTGRSHLEADLWTASTWRPPNPPNPAPFHLPLAGHPHPRPLQIPNSFLPTEPSCDAGGRSVPFPPSVPPPPPVSSDAETSPFPVIRALPLTAVAPLLRFASDVQIGRSTSPASSGAVAGVRSGAAAPWGSLKRVHVLPPFTRLSLLVA